MIPRRAHFYWHCDEPMPALRQAGVDSFKALNPDWEVFVHHGGDASDSFVRRVTKSDAARYGILHRAGGIYFDTDIIFVKPIPEAWLRSNLALPCYPSGEMYGVHALGCEEGSAFFKMAMQRVTERMQSPLALGCQSLGVKMWDGFDVLRMADACGCGVFPIPRETLLPFGWNEVENVWSPSFDLPECVGLHWYGGDRLSEEFQNKELSALPVSVVSKALEVTRGLHTHAV